MTETCDASNAKDLRSAIIAACAMLLTFAAVAVPVPLYAEYKIALGLTDADISLTMVSYLTGVLTTLFVGGSLSDALGRRPLVAAALLFGSLACALYIWLPNGAALQIARMVQGVSCGLTMSATSAFMLDCTSQRYRTFGTTIASTGCLIGMMIGSLGIGIYATFSRNYIPMFGVLIVLMMLNAVLLPLAQETVTQRITIRKAIKPLVRIPKNLRPVFPLAAGCYIAAWGTGVFFQSLSTPAAVAYFQSTDPLIPALMFALAMAPSALGGPMSARTTTRFAVYGGTALLCVSYAILWVTLTKGMTVPFLIADGVFSVSTGILLSASMHMLISYSDPADSASVVSLINFTGYVGSTVVSIAMSTIANTMALSTVLMIGFAISMVFMIPGFATKALRK